MKLVKKTLAAALSLTLCAAMIVPSFAASFTDLENAINGKSDTTENQITAEDGSTRYGYGSQDESSGQYEIEAWTEDGTRNITLNENVVYDAEKDGANGSIELGGESDAYVLDLNGNTVDGNGSNPQTGSSTKIFDVGNGDVTIKNGTITDSAGLGIQYHGRTGHLTLDNVDVINNDGNGVGAAAGGVGSSVTITGGSIRDNNGKGLLVSSNFEFSVDGVTISGNDGAGIDLRHGVSGTISDTVISDNGGRGLFMGSGNEATLDNTVITGNAGGIYAAGSSSVSTLTVKDSTITENVAPGPDEVTGDAQKENGGGIRLLGANVTLNIEGENEIHSNTSHIGASDIYAPAGSTVNGLDKTPKAPTGKQFDGWYDNDDKYDASKITFEEDVNLVGGLSNVSVSGNDTISPAEIELEDEAVPLAGLFTRADAIGYLWEQSGSPEWELSDFEDVPEDHEWAVAIGWAQANGIAVADLEGNFRPDDLVLRSVEDIELSPEGELEQFLNRYAVYAGIELDADELFIELGGEADDIIMGEDAQVIFDDFFAKLEVALAQAA